MTKIDADKAEALLEQARQADDEDRRWELIVSVTEIGPATVRALAQRLLADADPDERVLGADLVSAMPDVTEELRALAAERGFRVPETAPFSAADRAALAQNLRERLGREQDPAVIEAAIVAVGKIAAVELLPEVLGHVNDDDADVREACAWTLPSIEPDDGPTPELVEALVRLARDPVPDVRNWALFALGAGREQPLDTPETRKVFEENANHPNDEVREEARAALKALEPGGE